MRSEEERHRARVRLVEEHVAAENRHDLQGILRTFGAAPTYDDSSWLEQHRGIDAIRGYYERLLLAAPDLRIAIQNRHATDDAIVLEVIISGTHVGPWYELPATGKSFEFPLCAIYTFTDDDKLAGERIYYDRVTVLRQLGVLDDPRSLRGKLTAILSHPVTTTRILARAVGVRL